MALSQPALLDVLDALNAFDSTDDVIRKALQVMLQQLIDVEATAFTGAEHIRQNGFRAPVRPRQLNSMAWTHPRCVSSRVGRAGDQRRRDHPARRHL